MLLVACCDVGGRKCCEDFFFFLAERVSGRCFTDNGMPATLSLSLHFTSFRDVLEYGKLFVWCVVEKARRQEIDYMSSQRTSMEHGIDK